MNKDPKDLKRKQGVQALDELAQNYGFYIIIDQSFSKVIFDFEKWQSSYFINSDKVFIVDSFSKNYLLQGARVAATLVPTDMEENFINIHLNVFPLSATLRAPCQNSRDISQIFI